MAPPASKSELRERLRGRIEAIDPATAARAASRIADRVLALPEIERAEQILTCLSFGSEVDTWRLIERLRSAGKSLFVPRADPGDGRLHVHPFPCPLRTLAFGLQQPRRDAPELEPGALDETLDAALVLGLGFDRRGFRLGYGSGYFDRFLVRRPFPAIGLAYAAQIEEALPAERHDVPMQLLVTEDGVYRPPAA